MQSLVISWATDISYFRCSLTIPTYQSVYEETSLIITTNLNFGQWAQVFVDAKMTAALIDRIAHHCEL